MWFDSCEEGKMNFFPAMARVTALIPIRFSPHANRAKAQALSYIRNFTFRRYSKAFAKAR